MNFNLIITIFQIMVYQKIFIKSYLNSILIKVCYIIKMFKMNYLKILQMGVILYKKFLIELFF